MNPNKPEILLSLHREIVRRSDWWRKNCDDPHGINTAVSVALTEVANSINSVLVKANKTPPTKTKT